MAQFVVLTINDNDVPALGVAAVARVYRGDHADEATAVAAAAEKLGCNSGDRLWATGAGGLTRYTNTTTISRAVAAG